MPTNRVNTHFLNYEVLAELRPGPIRVLKAQHLPTGDLVVINEYTLAADADMLRRLEHEAERIRHIDHPNLVRVRDVQVKATAPYIVMDFVEAADLRSLLSEEGFLDIPTTTRLGLQLTGALRAMHARHLSHRAINPETILYRRLASGELHILLTDLGMGNFWADDTVRTLTDESLMNYEYAAPEQFDKPRQVDEAVDYYALGVVLYECLTGKVPFVLHNERELIPFMQQVLTAPMPVFTTASGQPLSPSLATLLMCLLARNPQDRLGNVDQLELLLEQSRVEQLNAIWSAANGPTTRTEADPLLPVMNADVDEPVDGQLKQPVSRKRKWWVELCILLAAGLAFGLYSRTVRQQPDHSAVEKDSIASISEKMPERPKLRTKSAVIAPINQEEKELNVEKNTAMDTVSQVSAEPAYSPIPAADSTQMDRPAADSVVVVPPDSLP